MTHYQDRRVTPDRRQSEQIWLDAVDRRMAPRRFEQVVTPFPPLLPTDSLVDRINEIWGLGAKPDYRQIKHDDIAAFDVPDEESA